MNKIIAIATISAATAFFQAQAQEAPQTQRTQDDVTQLSRPNPVAEEKVEIEKSELPKEVMNSFENSKYGTMDIVTVYEVNSSPKSASPQAMNTNVAQAEDTASSSTTQPTSASSPLEEATPTGVGQNIEEAVQETEQVATDVARETEERVNNAAMETEGLVDDSSQSAGNTVTDEAQKGDMMQEKGGAPLEDNQQSNETTAEMSENVAGQPEEAMTETTTTEDREDTGEVVAAAAPEVDEPTAQPTTAEEQGQELYQNNQYDNYTEANRDAYQEIAEEETDQSGGESKQYELQVQGEAGDITLTYDEDGE